MNFKHLKEEEKRKAKSIYLNDQEEECILLAAQLEGRDFSGFTRFYSLKRAKEILDGDKKYAETVSKINLQRHV